jgi:hypothetical protein
MLRAVQAIVAHRERFARERAEAASRRASHFGTFSYHGVKNILVRALDLEPPPAGTACTGSTTGGDFLYFPFGAAGEYGQAEGSYQYSTCNQIGDRAEVRADRSWRTSSESEAGFRQRLAKPPSSPQGARAARRGAVPASDTPGPEALPVAFALPRLGVPHRAGHRAPGLPLPGPLGARRPGARYIAVHEGAPDLHRRR